MKCSGAPQATVGGSWSLQNHNSSALSVSQSPQEAPRSTPIHDPSALSTFQSLSSHHPSALPRFFEALGATEINIHRLCRCPKAPRELLETFQVTIHWPCQRFRASEKPPRDPQEHPRGAQEAPKRPPRAPKRGPRWPQDALKSIFGSKTHICFFSRNRRMS